MGAVKTQAVRAAYLGQQASLRIASGLVQSLLRRFALGYKPEFSRAAMAAVGRRYVDLLRTDLANVEAGIYPDSLLFSLPWSDYAKRLPALARDLPRVYRRMKRGDYKDLPQDVDLSDYPHYYRRTFHWQSDGYLSRDSAEIYDVAVEFLFGGTADVMRRQALVPIHEFARSAGDDLRILDLACGTGRTLNQLAAALPNAKLTGLDLSRYYLDVARGWLPDAVDLVEGNAEATDFAAGSFDAITCVYLFHELPRNARRSVFAEMFRLLRPGGRLVVLDSVQRSDAAEIVYFLDRFQRELHEPFYRDYIEDDLAEGLRSCGFEVDVGGRAAYLTKVVCGRKPLH